jgi:hypothetical protein
MNKFWVTLLRVFSFGIFDLIKHVYDEAHKDDGGKPCQCPKDGKDEVQE